MALKQTFRPALLAGALIFLAALPSLGQTPTQSFSNDGVDTTPPSGITVEQIIQKFTEKEKEFAQARNNYVYRRSVKVQTLADDGTPDGELQEVVDITYDDKGRPRENVVFAPQNTLVRLSLDPEDYEDIRHRYPFVLTSADITQYQIIYVGKQKLDELDTYVFDIAPKNLQKEERLFQGRIWVDQQDLQVVKTSGRPAYLVPQSWIKHPENMHLFPAFTSYREQVDGKFWFPTYVKADEVLHFPGNPKKKLLSEDVHLRIIVKYTDYKRFGSSFKIRILDDKGNPVDDIKQPPPPAEKKKP